MTMPKLPPSQKAIYDALAAADGPLTITSLMQAIRDQRGQRMVRGTVSVALSRMSHLGLVGHVGTAQRPNDSRLWSIVAPSPDEPRNAT